ncbi:MAG: peptidylprolyl isomerase [Candidatus Omnitrophica bacterium]|nr:peptidylprolyl isomerase [Candidatus Omnitrophota bacterium]
MNIRHILIVILSASLTLAFGCAKEPSPDDKVLVKISNSTITLKDFKTRIEKLPPYYRNMVEKDRKRYLEEMIAEKLFYEEALRRGLNNDKEVAEIVMEAKRKIVIAKLIKNDVEDKVKVSEDEIASFYAANKDKLKTPEMWRASQILVPTEQEAKEILQKLNSGGNFEDIARAQSKDATASRGGDIGYFRAGQLVPDFEKAALSLDVGQLSDVVHTKFGYHIIKLTDNKAPDMQTYEKAKPLIENELRKKKKAELFYELVMALKKKYGVNIDESAFSSKDPLKKEDKPDGEI